jgi:DNA-binding transcriptional regulator YiaG
MASKPLDRKEDKLEAVLERAAQRRAAAHPLPTPAERVRLRKTVGLTQQEAAEALEVSLATVKAWEAGKWDPRPGPARERYLRFLTRLADEAARIEQQGGQHP